MPKLPEKIPPKFVATPLVCRECRAEGICSTVKMDDGRLVSLCWDCADDRHQAWIADERSGLSVDRHQQRQKIAAAV